MKVSIPLLLISIVAATQASAGNPVEMIVESKAKAIDLDGDGKPDLKRTFNSIGEVASYEMAHEKMRRGKNGELIYKYDRDHDGRFEETRTRQFDKGQLSLETIEIDRNGDGRPDVRIERTINYQKGVIVELTEYDDDFSGRFARRTLRRIPLYGAQSN